MGCASTKDGLEEGTAEARNRGGSSTNRRPAADTSPKLVVDGAEPSAPAAQLPRRLGDARREGRGASSAGSMCGNPLLPGGGADLDESMLTTAAAASTSHGAAPPSPAHAAAAKGQSFRARHTSRLGNDPASAGNDTSTAGVSTASREVQLAAAWVPPPLDDTLIDLDVIDKITPRQNEGDELREKIARWVADVAAAAAAPTAAVTTADLGGSSMDPSLMSFGMGCTSSTELVLPGGSSGAGVRDRATRVASSSGLRAPAAVLSATSSVSPLATGAELLPPIVTRTGGGGHSSSSGEATDPSSQQHPLAALLPTPPSPSVSLPPSDTRPTESIVVMASAVS